MAVPAPCAGARVARWPTVRGETAEDRVKLITVHEILKRIAADSWNCSVGPTSFHA
ncbi:hypothetical protein [Oryza sativa Japonica Group]|uniref:Uncharacterized protein n=1 Tax=Oryza sativa subsp. japonica TaxID=39947 RepID=Q5N9R2_ORYSJ|nr:hypothetical protein [Oryza sativa Japonica Group]